MLLPSAAISVYTVVQVGFGPTQAAPLRLLGLLLGVCCCSLSWCRASTAMAAAANTALCSVHHTVHLLTCTPASSRQSLSADLNCSCIAQQHAGWWMEACMHACKTHAQRHDTRMHVYAASIQHDGMEDTCDAQRITHTCG